MCTYIFHAICRCHLLGISTVSLKEGLLLILLKDGNIGFVTVSACTGGLCTDLRGIYLWPGKRHVKNWTMPLVYCTDDAWPIICWHWSLIPFDIGSFSDVSCLSSILLKLRKLCCHVTDLRGICGRKNVKTFGWQTSYIILCYSVVTRLYTAYLLVYRTLLRPSSSRDMISSFVTQVAKSVV